MLEVLANQSQFTYFIASNGYVILFLLMFLDGVFAGFVAALIASLGFFNIYLVFIIVITGDILGDILAYYIGRLGHDFLINIFGRKGKRKLLLTNEDIVRVEDMIKEHPGKALSIIKITPPITNLGLISAGAVNIPFRKFLFYTSIISIISDTFILLLGYTSGISIQKFSQFLQSYQIAFVIMIAITIIFWYIYRKLLTEIRNKHPLDLPISV